MTVIRIYQVNQTQAYSIWETGTFYSLGMVNPDDDAGYYSGACFPTERVLEVAKDVEIFANKAGGVTFKKGEVFYTAGDLLDRQGHIVDARFGQTRPAQSGEQVVEDVFTEYVKTELFYLINTQSGYVVDEARARDQEEAELIWQGRLAYSDDLAVVRAAQHECDF